MQNRFSIGGKEALVAVPPSRARILRYYDLRLHHKGETISSSLQDNSGRMIKGYDSDDGSGVAEGVCLEPALDPIRLILGLPGNPQPRHRGQIADRPSQKMRPLK